MKLNSISIENYRSIKEKQTIRVDNLSIFIGENNSGKSNILNAIKVAIQNGSMTHDDFFDTTKNCVISFDISNLTGDEETEFQNYLIFSEGKKTLSLKMTFSASETDDSLLNKKIEVKTKIPHDLFLKEVIEDTFNGRTIAKQVKEDVRFADLIGTPSSFLKDDAVKIVRVYVQTKLNEGEYDLDYAPFPLIRRLYELMPEFLFIPAVKAVEEELSGGKHSTFNLILTDIFSLLCSDEQCNENIEADRKKRDKIKKFCESIEKYFNDNSSKMNMIKNLENDLSDSLSEHICDTKVNFSFATPTFEDVLGVPQTLIDDGCKTTVDKKGHGLQRALILAILKLYVGYMKEGQKQDFFIGIEEPEIYLHPHSQRKMFDILKKLSISNQIFITTHSAVLVNKMNNPENIIKISKIKNESKIKQLNKGYFGSDELFKIEKNLTVGNSEMFFSKKVIFVEGDTEKCAIPLLAKKLGVDFDEKGISIVSTGSGDNFEPFLRLVITCGFNIPYVIMCDCDKLNSMINLLNKLNITKASDFLQKTESEKRRFLKTKNCYVLEYDFETIFAKNVNVEIILSCLSELKGKSITEADIENLKQDPANIKTNIKNRFNFIIKELGIKSNYPDIEAKYKDLIEELYSRAESENNIESNTLFFDDMLAKFMKVQNKPKLGKTLGERIEKDMIPPQIKEIINILK